MFMKTALVGVFLVLRSAAAIEMREVESELGYKMWVGQESGTDSYGAVERAYEAMLRAGGKAKMMACTSTDSIVFCASSATGEYTKKPYPVDFKEKSKKVIASCGKAHNQGSRCAEPMLLDAMLQWTGGAIPKSTVYAYGVGRGTPGITPPEYQKPCSNKGGTFGCKSMLATLGWNWSVKEPAAPVSGGASKAGPSGPSAARVPAPPGGAAPKGAPKRRRSVDLLESELAIRALFDDLVEDWDWIQARDVTSQDEDLLARDLDSFLYF